MSCVRVSLAVLLASILAIYSLLPSSTLAGQGPPLPARSDLRPSGDVGPDGLTNREDLAFLRQEAARMLATRNGQSSRGVARAASSEDGTWMPYPPPTRRYASSAIYDPLRDRLIVFAGQDGGNFVWTLNLTGTPTWTLLQPAGTAPTWRRWHSAIYDSNMDRMIVFGGLAEVADDYAQVNETWALSLSGTPTWSQLTPSGTPPPARDRHVAVYDPLGNRMIVFGGTHDATGNYNDTWELTLGSMPVWTQLSPTGGPPAKNSQASAIYDPVRQQMVVYGDGVSGVWTLSLSGAPVWTQLAVSGTAPSNRKAHQAIYDPTGDRMIVFGGAPDGWFSTNNETWALSLGGSPTWTQLAPSGALPAARAQSAAAFDSGQGRMIIFGGYLGTNPYEVGDVWALSLADSLAWAQIPAGPAPPSRRYEAAAIYDPLRDRILLFGGSTESGLQNDLWELPLTTPLQWHQLSPMGGPPGVRSGHSAVYDPEGDRVIVFGGLGTGSTLLNDVWELALSGEPAWQQLFPSGSPPSTRRWHSAVYDPLRHRMVVFGGGIGTFSTKYNDVWELTLSGAPAWNQLTPVGTPPIARGGQSCILDPRRDRLIICCGIGAGGFDFPPHYSDTWELSLASPPTWSELLPDEDGPWARTEAAAYYDPLEDRMVLYGGGVVGYFPGTYEDTWALNLSGSPVWTELTPAGTLPTYRLGHVGIYDPLRDRLVVFGGNDQIGGVRNDTWELLRGTPTSVPGGLGGSTFLLSAFPNPFNSGATLRFTLPEPAHVSLSVYDVQGRLVDTPVSGRLLTEGDHAIWWDGTRAGRPLPAGIYFSVLSTGERTITRKLVRLQ